MAGGPLLALSGHPELRCTCPLSGVERTTFGGELHLHLRRSDLSNISRPAWSEKTRRGKQRGKQFDAVCKKALAGGRWCIRCAVWHPGEAGEPRTSDGGFKAWGVPYQ